MLKLNIDNYLKIVIVWLFIVIFVPTHIQIGMLLVLILALCVLLSNLNTQTKIDKINDKKD